MSFRIAHSATFFASKEEYLHYIADWKARARAKSLTAEDCLLHALVTGKDVYRAFAPSRRALNQGRHPYSTVADLVWAASHPRESAFPAEPLQRLRAYLAVLRTTRRLNLPTIALGNPVSWEQEVAA